MGELCGSNEFGLGGNNATRTRPKNRSNTRVSIQHIYTTSYEHTIYIVKIPDLLICAVGSRTSSLLSLDLENSLVLSTLDLSQSLFSEFSQPLSLFSLL